MSPLIEDAVRQLLEPKLYDNGSITFALSGDANLRVCIDINEVERIVSFSPNWYLSSNGYVFHTHYKDGTQYLHRLIVGNPDNSVVVDHINGNKRDNRKSNLQTITHRQNVAKGRGISKYGVNITMTEKGKYRVRLIHNQKTVNLGNYDTPEQAKNVRNNWYIQNNITTPVE